MGAKKQYDAIIIGSGIGGLTAGAYLAKQGNKVLLLEQHSQPGGYFCSFNRKGFVFDGGIQAIEDSGIFIPLLRQLGLDRRLHLERTKFAFASPDFFCPLLAIDDVLAYYRHLQRLFPAHAQEIEKLGYEAKSLCEAMRAFSEIPNPLFAGMSSVIKELPAWTRKNRGYLRALCHFARLMQIPIEDYLPRIVSDPELVAYFSSLGYRGAPASFALAFVYFFIDYYYPLGGIQAISDTFSQAIQEWGGEIRYRSLATQILMAGEKAAGVELDSGERFFAPYIISNGDAIRTFTELLPVSATPPKYRARLKSTPLAESVFTVYLGVDIPSEKLPVDGCHHVFYMPDYHGVDYQAMKTNPNFYQTAPFEISIPSLHDSNLAPPGKSTIILQSISDYHFLNDWKAKNGKKTKEYRALKKKCAADLIANAEKLIPGLTKKIVYQDEASPLTHERYTLNREGATVGWTYHPQEGFNRGLKGLAGFMTPVKNLYLVGHWAMSPGGAPSGLITGKVVSDLINWRRRLHI